MREFPASFEILEEGALVPQPDPGAELDKDLGWMLHDIDFSDNATPRFFRAFMKGGVIEVPPWQAGAVKG